MVELSKAATVIILDSRMRVLLLLRDDDTSILFPNMWDLPGGALETGETPIEAAQREVAEEIDLHENLTLSFVTVRSTNAWQDWIFLATLTGTQESVRVHEGQKSCWVPVQEAVKQPLAFQHEESLACAIRLTNMMCLR